MNAAEIEPFNQYRRDMELMDTTRQARFLTNRLSSALDGQDMEQWLELLDARGRAMLEFDNAHRRATAEDRETCRGEILALQEEDRTLQERSENLLEQFAGEFREQVGSSSNGGNPKGMPGELACIDRKA